MNLHMLAVAGDSVAVNNLLGSGEISSSEIIVTPEIILNVLSSYLDGHIKEQDLQNWADLLTTNESYIGPEWSNDELADKYEPMWSVLQCLSSPEIDGVICCETVNKYRREILDLIESTPTPKPRSARSG